jgi:hypothetical protein
MKVELKKLKIHKELSQETTAFTCEIWVSEDRLKSETEFVCYARNYGHGGPNDYLTQGAERSWELFEKLTTYAKRFCEESSDSTVLDSFIDNHVAMQKNLKKGIVYIDKNSFELFKLTFKVKKGEAVSDALKTKLNARMLSLTYEGHHVINSKRFT